MNKVVLSALFLVGLFTVGLSGQEEFDTIYKFPDRQGQRVKIIRGLVTAETKKEVVYTIGAGQTKRIDPELVFKVLYKAPASKQGVTTHEMLMQGLSEFESGRYGEAATILEQGTKEFKKDPSIPKAFGAYLNFYAGRAYYELAMQMKLKDGPKVLIKRRFKSSVKYLKKFKEDYPDHRLQFDFPIAYAKALIQQGKDSYSEAVKVLSGVRTNSRNQYVMLRKYQAMKLRGDILKLKGQSDEALKVYEDILRGIPGAGLIDELLAIKQDVSVFIGMVLIDKKNYGAAEEYFRKILEDVSATGVAVKKLGHVYLAIGKCRAHAKDWEGAQWFFLHGCIGYFKDPQVHRESLFNVIKSIDHVIGATTKKEKKVELVNSIKEYYRQLKDNYGASKEQVEARKIYKKY